MLMRINEREAMRIEETIKFTIPNFEALPHTRGEFISSPIEKAFGYDWQIRVYPRCHEACVGYDRKFVPVSCFLYRCSREDKGDVTAEICFRVGKVEDGFNEHTFKKPGDFAEKENYFFKGDWEDIVDRHLEWDGSLIVECYIRMPKDDFNVQSICATSRIAENDLKALSEVCENILGSFFFSQGWTLTSIWNATEGVFKHSLVNYAEEYVYDHFHYTRTTVKTDFFGRITHLRIYQDLDDSTGLDLSPAIRSLKNLKELHLEPFGDIHEISELPNLEKLTLRNNLHTTRSEEIFWRLEIKLPRLKVLCIEEELRQNASPHPKMKMNPLDLLPWIVENMPSLQTLHLQGFWSLSDRHSNPPVFENTDRCHNCLEHIRFENWGWGRGSRLLEIFFFHVLPMFPKVSTLNLRGNWINRFESIVNRFESIVNRFDTNRLPPRSIPLTLDLDQDGLDAIEDTTALCSFLRESNVFIPQLLSNRNRQVQYENVLNLAGRGLIEDRRTAESLSISAWVNVLARMNRQEENYDRLETSDVATGIFILLRNGPLLNRSTWSSASDTTTTKKKREQRDDSDQKPSKKKWRQLKLPF